MNTHGQRVAVVTGGRGFAASHLISHLRLRGYYVVSVVRDNVPEGTRDSSVAEVFGDVRDTDLIYRVLIDYDATHLAHLAAQAIVPKALENPYETWDSNVRGTYSVLEACRRYHDLKGILVQSSDKALGTQAVPYSESAPLNGIFPYDASKAAAEIVAHSYQKTYGLPIVVSRCSNLFGPGDTNSSRIIPDTILSTLQGDPVTIRSDGTPSRDYLFISDAIEGLGLLLERAAEFQGEVFHFGTGVPVSVLDLVWRILELMDKRILRPIILGTAKGEIDTQYLNSDKAKRLLGWEPATPLDYGLQQTIAWWRQYTKTYDKVYNYEMGLSQ